LLGRKDSGLVDVGGIALATFLPALLKNLLKEVAISVGLVKVVPFSVIF